MKKITEPRATFIINQNCLHQCHFSGFQLICQLEVAPLVEIKTARSKLVNQLIYLNSRKLPSCIFTVYLQNRNMDSADPLGDKYENDWRYLAVTAFLVKPPDSR